MAASETPFRIEIVTEATIEKAMTAELAAYISEIWTGLYPMWDATFGREWVQKQRKGEELTNKNARYIVSPDTWQ